jgi:holin-like protein
MLLVYIIIIFGFLALGELIVYVTGIHFPASLIGMLLLTFALHKRWIKLEWVKEISDVLVGNLGLFFIPPSISVMVYFNLIANNLLAIVTAVVISTVLVLFTTGRVYQFLRKRKR